MPKPSQSPESTMFLMDNGSLEPAAILALRTVAAQLTEVAGRVVRPVSLLHSSTVAARLLDGRPAEIVEPALRQLAETGKTEVVIVPFFIGPSAALVNYLPERIRHLRETWPNLRVRLAPCLADAAQSGDQRLAIMLAEYVRAAAMKNKFSRPAVAVVDHGTPQRAVHAVRELVTEQTRALLGNFVRTVAACSMERRPAPEFAFNEPLLASLLDAKDFSSGEVVVAKLFLSPGRHAGPDGDVEQIGHAAAARHPGVKFAFTEPLGSHPGLLPILHERLDQGLAAKILE